jgi:hypothetical protein
MEGSFLNKQLRTTQKKRSSNFGIGQVAEKSGFPSPLKRTSMAAGMGWTILAIMEYKVHVCIFILKFSPPKIRPFMYE